MNKLFTARYLTGTLLAICLFFVIAPTKLNAAPNQNEIINNVSIPLTTTNWSDVVALPQFDPSLGTLTSIDIALTGLITGNAKYESNDSAPGTITLNLEASIELQRPDNTSLLMVTPLTAITDTAEAFDGVIDFGGLSGNEFFDLAASVTENVTLDSDADLALFSGTGTVDLSLAATGNSRSTGLGNVINLFNTNAGAEIVVTYTYLAPAIDIQKTPDSQTVSSGSPATFTIQVENTGDVDLVNVAVSDPLAPDCDNTIGALAVDEIVTYQCTLANVTAEFTNVASVVGEDGLGNPVEDSDDAQVFVLELATIGDFVWNDLNTDGIQNDDEAGIEGITVNLLMVEGPAPMVEIDSTTTDANGLYAFTELQPGEYALEFILPNPSYEFSPANSTDDAKDSDVNPATGTTGTISLLAGENDDSWDAGLIIRPFLTVDKDDGGMTAEPGSTIRYSINYTNLGPGEALNVTITERVPEFTTFDVEGSSDDWRCENDQVVAGTVCMITIPRLSLGESNAVELIFAVTVDEFLPANVDTIENEVSITSENTIQGAAIDRETTPVARPTSLNKADEPDDSYQPGTIFVPFINH